MNAKIFRIIFVIDVLDFSNAKQTIICGEMKKKIQQHFIRAVTVHILTTSCD